MAVKIKLKRLGKIRAPYYRIVVADARTKRDGRAIEEIGKYHPKAEPSFIEVNSERAQHWLSVGAQPTDPVRKIFEITGDWQKFKSLPGTEGTLKSAPPREDRKEIFAAAVRETMGESAAPAKGRTRSSSAGRGGKDAAGKDTAGGQKTREKAASQKKAEQPAKAKSGDAAADGKGKGRSRPAAKRAAASGDSDTAGAAAAQAQAAEADPDAAASGAEPANGA